MKKMTTPRKVRPRLFPSFSVPPAWSEQADVQAYIDVFDEAEDYFGDIKERLEAHYAKLHGVLNAALGYFLRKLNFPIPFPMAAMTVAEKVEWLQSLICREGRDENYLERFAEHLTHILWVDTERRRLLREYQDPTAKKWLYPLCHLSDGLIAAGVWLEEGMRLEHDDYDGELDAHGIERVVGIL